MTAIGAIGAVVGKSGYYRNRENLLARQRSRSAGLSPEAKREANKRYYYRNRAKILERKRQPDVRARNNQARREWRRRNPEKAREADRRKNRERVLEKRRIRYWANHAKMLAMSRARNQNPAYREEKRLYNQRYRQTQRYKDGAPARCESSQRWRAANRDRVLKQHREDWYRRRAWQRALGRLAAATELKNCATKKVATKKNHNTNTK